MTEPVIVTFRSQLIVWKRVCFALFLREIQSQFSDRLGLAWAFLEPFAFIFGLAFLRSLISGSDVHGLPILLFMMVGLISLQSFLQPFNKVAAAYKLNKPLYAFRQVQPIAGLIVTTFIEYTIKVGVLVLACLALYLLEIDVPIHDPLLLIFLFHLLWLMTFSIGCLLGIATSYVPEIKKMTGILSRPLFFISCVFYSLQDIPREYWKYFTWNPLVHFIEMGRYALLESYGHEGVSVSYPLIVTFIAFFFAICLYHINWKGLLAR